MADVVWLRPFLNCGDMASSQEEVADGCLLLAMDCCCPVPEKRWPVACASSRLAVWLSSVGIMQRRTVQKGSLLCCRGKARSIIGSVRKPGSGCLAVPATAWLSWLAGGRSDGRSSLLPGAPFCNPWMGWRGQEPPLTLGRFPACWQDLGCISYLQGLAVCKPLPLYDLYCIEWARQEHAGGTGRFLGLAGQQR